MSVVLGSVGGEWSCLPDDLLEACEGLRTGAAGGEMERREVREGLWERAAPGRGEGGNGGEGVGREVEAGALGEGGGLYTLFLEVTMNPPLPADVE